MELVQSMVDGVAYALFLNPATLSGAIDVVVVKHPDGTLHSTPFHVRFGKLQVLQSSEKIVQLTVNGQSVPLTMKLGVAGEAFFVEELKENELRSSSEIHEELPLDKSQNNGKKRKWTWGWGALPKISTAPGALDSDSNQNLTDSGLVTSISQQELSLSSDAIPTPNANTITNVTPTPTSTPTNGSSSYKSMTSLFTIFSKKKSQTNPTNDPTNESTPTSTPTNPSGEAVREGNDSDAEDIFFDMDDYDDFSEAPAEEDSRNQLITSRENPEFFMNDEVYFTPPVDREDSESQFTTIYKHEQRRHSITKSVGFVDTASNADWLSRISKQELLKDNGIAISLCASQIFGPIKTTPEQAQEIFDQNIITHQKLCADPALLSAPQQLVVQLKGKIFPWSVAGPVVFSVLLFGEPLDMEVIEKLENNESIKQKKKSDWMSWLYPNRWKRSAMPSPGALPAFTEDDPVPVSTPTATPTTSPMAAHGTNPIPVSQSEGSDPELKNRYKSSSVPNVRHYALHSDDPTAPKNSPPATASIKSPEAKRKVEYRKLLRPTADQLSLLNLQPGANSIEFSVTSEFRGTQTLHSTIYLWDYDSKLVISDIDGTITRSDALGHVLPMLGKDWSHSGVAKLFSSIRENGYHIMYLTSRAIGQAQTTRNFINSLKQDGDICLPKGPVFMSPDRLFWAFSREVIRRKPEEFKIACLEDIKGCFPPGTNPFYAGYGNRITDAIAYKVVGVPQGRVFIINPRGEITTMNKTFKKTYHNLNDLVHEMFPQTHDYRKGVSEDYNDWNYWKIPLPDLEELES